MPFDYEAIGEEHRRLYGENAVKFGNFLAGLYHDRTHFLLELLQNAQDADATRVRFDLNPDQLEIRHDGRPFTEADVRGICGMLDSTKQDDASQIGRFGVGFKSVYAYTSRPAVHCGDEHFHIQDYVLPYEANPVDPRDEWSTLQILPFDRADRKPEDAVVEISGGLQRLSARTILFLSNLTELEWFAPGGLSEHILRETRKDRAARRVCVLAGADSEPEEEWLVFHRPVHLADGVDPGTVEVAFALTPDDRGGELITSAQDTELVAFFPTSQETHVGFLIQGPFVPTPARDNIRHDDPLNQRLVVEVAELTIKALEEIKEMGLLKVGALETLPLDAANFRPGHLFHPLYASVREALTNRPLLPTADGRHLAAPQVRLARSAGLRKLFSPEQLGQLLESDGEIAWLDAGISADRTPELHRYLVGHQRFSFVPDFAGLVPNMELDAGAVVRRIDPSFLARQSTDWIISLYRWLATQPALRDIIRVKPLIRRSDGEHVAAFDYRDDDDEAHKPQVWLPPDGETAFPVVDPAVAADPEALEFLRGLGLTKPDAADDVIHTILPRYRGDEMPDQDEHTSNLDRIAAALSCASGAKLGALATELRKTPFLLAYNAADNTEYWCEPGECYEPSEELTVLMEGNGGVFFLTDESLCHIDQWRRLGVRSEIEITVKKPDWRGYVTVCDHHGWHVRGLHRFDPDLEIVGLERALEQQPTLERSLLIWQLISSLNAPIRGLVERCPRKNYSDSSTYPQTSAVADLLAAHPWLLDRDGNWRTADEVTLDDLDPSYPRDEAMVRRLGLRPTVSREVAAGVADLLKINSDELDLLRRHPDLVKRYLAEASERERGAGVDEGADEDETEDDDEADDGPVDMDEAIFDAFNRAGATDLEEFTGDGAAANPARRQERSAAALADSKAVEPARGDRFQFLSRKVWERKDPAVRAYLLSTYGGRCQICDMTFPRHDGQPYFEARYIVSRIERRWLDTPGNSLCLCPTCLAKTLHGSSHAADILDELRELVESAANLPEGGSIRFELCGEPVSMRFAQRHLIDLGALLTAESAEP